MAESKENTEHLYCLGCLCTYNEHKIQDYRIQYAHFWAIFEVGIIKLCYLCKRMAQHAEVFIQNVQCNQILLENCLGDPSTTIQETRSQLQPSVTLSLTSVDTFYLTGNDSNDLTVTSENFTVTGKDSKAVSVKPMLKCDDQAEILNTNVNKMLHNVTSGNLNEQNNGDFEKNHVKLELKEEDIVLDHLEGEFVDNEEFQDPYVKEEDDFPLKVFLKKEIQIEGIAVKHLQRSLRKKKVKKKESSKKLKRVHRKQNEDQNNEVLGIEKINITEEECMQERKQLALDQKYLNCTYKCEDCLKGFNFKAGYDAHLEKHSTSMGAFKCSVCKLRMDTEDKLVNHKRYHSIRYKCTECGLVRISRATIKDHYSAFHRQGEKQYPCSYCGKAFKRQVSQRKHVRYTHLLKKDRDTCGYCHKTYKNKEVLKAHMMHTHPKEVSAIEPVRRYACEECGMAFKTPSHLKNHSVKHSVSRDYYCVECDKAFKSEGALKQHLKTAQPHVNYIELPLSCQLCEKKFAIRRDLERHMNSVHLDVKPFKCDKCDKAYVNNWSLNDHKRHVHEGYKRPLRYPCKFCDKIFDRNSILKAHIRTHTGERPYQCSKCPAQFSQSGVLATHDKLIHLQLTRDGRPKHNFGK